MAKKKMIAVIKVLKKTYPDVKCSLDYKTPYQLLVATILSAQCTDERVNLVTPDLFRNFPDPKAMAAADIKAIEKLIQSAGFYKTKALALKESAKVLVEKHGSKLPKTIEELTHLRGVGRKTANVVLGNAFGIQSGVVVDTHVGRLARRMGFTQNTDPVKVEEDLKKLIPQDDWTIFSHLMIYHGRARCMARGPDCAACELVDDCPKVGVEFKKKPALISHKKLMTKKEAKNVQR